MAGAWKPDAFIGVSTPLVPSWTWLSVTAGVDLTSPKDDWFGGISLLRLIPYFSTESLPIDIHLLGHWGRSPVLQNRDDCASGKPCRTESQRRFHGLAGSVSIDAASLFTDLIKALGS